MTRRGGRLVAAALVVSVAPALAEPPPREVNLTTDSAPGWVPTVADEPIARRRLDAYFQAVDGGQFSDAHAIMTAQLQAMLPLAKFLTEMDERVHRLGLRRDRRILKVTWTKGPAESPQPGIYAAVDFAVRYTTSDRNCGYAILF